MASDEEDEELKALRLAVLLSMKNSELLLTVVQILKTVKEESPKREDETDLKALREVALATKKQHAITSVKSSSPWQNTASNSPVYSNQLPFSANPPFPPNHLPFSTNLPPFVRNPTFVSIQPRFPGSYSQFNNQPHSGPPGGFRTSNLIVINPEPEKSSIPQALSVTSIAVQKKSGLIRPQDRWCSPNTGTQTVEEDKKPKVSSKFSRYNSSDSESSDISSDSVDDEKESPKRKSDSSSDSHHSDSKQSVLDSESDIEKQIDALLNSPSKNVKKPKEKVTDTNVKLPEVKVTSAQTVKNPVKEVGKADAKPIPTLIGASKTMLKKRVNNAWSDSDSDSGVRSGRKSKQKRSWSDQGSSDDEKAAKGKRTIVSIAVTDAQKIKTEERRKRIENDLQKTMQALQNIKEKRLKQEAAKKSTLPDKSEKTKESKSHSPKLKKKSPTLRSSHSFSRSPRRRSISPRRRRSSSPRHRSPSHRQRGSASPRRHRSPSPRRWRSPRPRRRSLSPISRRNSVSPNIRRRRSPALSRSNRSPLRPKEKRVLTSEEWQKIEARRKKFEKSNTVLELKKTVSLKGVPMEGSPPPNLIIKGPKERQLKAQERRRSRVSKENKKDNNTKDSDASVSSLSDSDSDEEGRSWRKEKNKSKHICKRTEINDNLERPFKRGDRRERRERPNRDRAKADDVSSHREISDRVSMKTDCENRDKGENGDNSTNTGHNRLNRSDSHIYSDNIDRGFDASNYRKTKVDSGVASENTDSDEKSTNKKLLSIVLPSDTKGSSSLTQINSPVRKVECSEIKSSSPRQHRIRSERHKGKRNVITDDCDYPRSKRQKRECIADARNLLQAIKQQNDNSRKAVFKKDGLTSISITLQDQDDLDSAQSSPPKPSVHERLGRKVPSLLSLNTGEFARVPRRSRSPDYLDSKTKVSILRVSPKDIDSRDSRRSKSKKSKRSSDNSEKKLKKKRSIIHYESPDEAEKDDNALEKRIQIIKAKNAAILKRQAEIQQDKERFG